MAYGRKKSLDPESKTRGRKILITFPHVERRKFSDRFPIEIAFFVGHFGGSCKTVYQKNKTEPVFPFPAESLPVDGATENDLPAFYPCLFNKFLFSDIEKHPLRVSIFPQDRYEFPKW